MNKPNIVFLSAALAAGVGLSSCGAPAPAGTGQGAAQSSPAGGQAAASSPAAGASAQTPSATSTGSPSASAAPSATTATATPTPSPDGSATRKTFTFPDGHLSFSHPTDWTVRVEKTAPSANQPPGVDPVQAVLADGTGNELLSITSNAYGGGVSGPVLRTVLDSAPVPGLKDTSGEQLAFGFAFDSFADHPEFHMGIRRSREFEASPESSGSTQVPLANGLLDTRVLFSTPAFPSIDAARAWTSTEQYIELKRLLLSVKYQ
jgi:hypothetical protein